MNAWWTGCLATEMFLSHHKPQQHQQRPEDMRPQSVSPSLYSHQSSDPAALSRLSSDSLEKYGWFEDFDPSSPQHQQDNNNNRNHHHHRHYKDTNQQHYSHFDDEDEDDFDSTTSGQRLHEHEMSMSSASAGIHTTLQLPLPLTEPPSYILEAPLTSQHLWFVHFTWSHRYIIVTQSTQHRYVYVIHVCRLSSKPFFTIALALVFL